ncbi:SpoIIAA-like [Saccharicrinis carchari]|uniref:SpoIIAA-like n=1 Tax=Saccharicrinis carchari TaxID=1168039 RepID=A0A521D617_SACCC|nr:STAS/SEC14 domain-containing protein [Saccharicrinis carchari]SMO67129.1 SpoIIAA-like [Saccharicrinis carchari]
MKFSISVDHDLRIVRYTHSGLITKEDIGEAWAELLTMKEFTQLNYNLLSDYRKGKFEIPLDALPEIIEFLHTVKHVVQAKKQALIVNDPYSVAASILFLEKVGKETGFEVQVFSTKVSALNWLIAKL